MMPARTIMARIMCTLVPAASRTIRSGTVAGIASTGDSAHPSNQVME